MLHTQVKSPQYQNGENGNDPNNNLGLQNSFGLTYPSSVDI